MGVMFTWKHKNWLFYGLKPNTTMAVSDLTVIWEYSDSFLYLVSKLNCCCWAFLARSGNGFRFNIPLVTVSVLRQGLAKPSRLAWDSRCP